MSLSSIKAMKAEKGFTIVELLIVIVVIGILASIVIVAFNGVQNRAKTQSSQASASNVQKKIEAYNAATGSYPTITSYAALTTALNGQNESTLANSGITLGTPVNTTTTTVGIWNCTASGTGISVTWYDYAAATPGAVTAANGLKINYSGSCGTWTQAT